MADAATRPVVVVIGVGNSLRHDDAAGLEAVRRLRGRGCDAEIALCEHEGETLGLLERWQNARAVVLVDAIHSGATPGTIHRLDASAEPIGARLPGSSSTHALGVGEAIELARELRRLPARVVLYGVEGRNFEAGSGLSPEVAATIDALADAVHGEARSLAAATAAWP